MGYPVQTVQLCVFPGTQIKILTFMSGVLTWRCYLTFSNGESLQVLNDFIDIFTKLTKNINLVMGKRWSLTVVQTQNIF